MGKVNNPHDQFFKTLLSDVDAARLFLRAFLPKEISLKLNLDSLRVTTQSFIKDDLSNHFADLIFECKLRTDQDIDIFISLLYEHKSNPYKYTLFQVGGYLSDAYNQQINDRIKPIRLVIPVIYYHGDQEWEPGSMVDHFSHLPENFKKFAPEFDYVFQNLSQFSDEEIKRLEHNLLVPGLLMQKYFKNMSVLHNFLKEIIMHLNLLEEGGNFKRSSYVYLFELFDYKTEEIMDIMDELSLLTKDRSKNYVLRLMDEGMEKGMEKGMEITIAVSKFLQKGKSVEYICDHLDISPELVERIRKELEH